MSIESLEGEFARVTHQALILILLFSCAVAVFGFTVLSALNAGAEEYASRFTKAAAAQLHEMFIFMPATWILFFKMSTALFGAAMGALIGLPLGSPVKMLLPVCFLAVPFYFIPDYLITRFREARLAKFSAQLVDGLRIVSNSMGSNLALPEAVEVMVREVPNPMSQEFRLVMNAYNLGQPIDVALTELCRRIPLPDLKLWVASIVSVLYVGGEIGRICETAVNLVQERFKVEARVESVTAEGRLQSLLLAASPWVMMLLLWVTDPGVLTILFRTVSGLFILFLIITLDVVGYFWIRRITNISV